MTVEKRYVDDIKVGDVIEWAGRWSTVLAIHKAQRYYRKGRLLQGYRFDLDVEGRGVCSGYSRVAPAITCPSDKPGVSPGNE